MLTKTDLNAIGKLIDDKLEEKLETKLESKFNEKLTPIHTDIKELKKDVKKIKSDVDLIIRTFDREYLQLRARLERIEEHLKLPRLFEY